jgi:hypothetical protein
MGTGPRSDFLFVQPSVVSGLARLLDLWATFDAYNVSRSPHEADARALRADWRVTGQDLADAMARTPEPEPVQADLFAADPR